ncbi:hypothetical protein AAUPMC_10543, partial [Pasteurella multocida subsp. multocida str. Anand1_cattle]
KKQEILDTKKAALSDWIADFIDILNGARSQT